MRIALATMNPTVGALELNAAAIVSRTQNAKAQGADLVVFPELSLTGYPPKDLLLQRSFLEHTARTAKRVAQQAARAITVVFGAPLPLHEHGSAIANALLAYRDGELVGFYDKRLLPTYDVFDEDRYFTPGTRPVIIDVAGVRVGLSICEDLWRGHDVGFADRYLTAPDPVDELVHPPAGGHGAQVIVNPSASPFLLGKRQRHLDLLRAHAQRHRVYVLAVNQFGANDELIFDGLRCGFGPQGELLACSRPFDGDSLVCIDVEPAATAVTAPAIVLPPSSPDRDLFDALVLGISDYCRKSGFKSCVLGLSGGIDSAVCAVLAAAALGAGNVLGLSMPSRYSSLGSKDDAAELARALGVKYETVPVEPAFISLRESLGGLFAGKTEDVTEENLQSRIRGTLLMAASNKFGHILLTTGNKSELAVGYCTLYGDMNGGLAVLSDVTKILVYRLARWMNEHHTQLGISGLAGPPIPEASITKPPSAELRPDQTDQDSLPPYHVLDEIIERYVEHRESAAQIIAALASTADPAVVRRTIRMIDLAEYKRKQSPVGLKVTGVAFGSGRRMPIAQGWRPDLV